MKVLFPLNSSSLNHFILNLEILVPRSLISVQLYTHSQSVTVRFSSAPISFLIVLCHHRLELRRIL